MNNNFPDYNSHEHGIDSIVKYIPYLSAKNTKADRQLANLKILKNINDLKKPLKQAVIDKLFESIEDCKHDICQQEYLVRILLFQRDPHIDDRLIKMTALIDSSISHHHGLIAAITKNQLAQY